MPQKPSPERSEKEEESGNASDKKASFRSLAERLLKVPKAEIDDEEVKWSERQKGKP
jgi:hypothetical protein